MFVFLKAINTIIKIIISIFFLIYILQVSILLADDNINKLSSNKLNEIITLINNNKWDKAFKIAELEKSTDLMNLINWIKIFSQNTMHIDELIKSYEKYKNWPKSNYIKVLIEKKLKWEGEDLIYKNFFSRNQPISAIGKIKLANFNYENKNQEQIIIDNWTYSSFSKDDEKYIYKKYDHLFSKEIKNIRLNHLLWNKNWSSAYRMLDKINSDSKNLYKARIKLSRREYGVDTAIKNIPKNLLTDQGLIYERIKWRRISKLDSSYDLLKKFLNSNEDLNFANKWWSEIIIHSRSLLNKKEYNKAYNLLSKHKQSSHYNVSQAEWLLGWIALTKLSKPELALKHFLAFEKIVNMPISLARANYWLAITNKELNDLEMYENYIKKAASYNTTYYGLIAEQLINDKKPVKLINIESKKIIYDVNNNEILIALRLLARANEKKYSTKFINGLFHKEISNQEIYNILKIVIEEKRPDLFIKTCKKAVRINAMFQYCLFPYPNNIKISEVKRFIDNALIFGIIKQESEFYTHSISRAGAQGLMQIIPSTAKITAKSLNIKYDKNKILSDTDYNIMIGSKYFSDLLAMFDNSIVLSIASYNAGPTNVKKWIKIYGDPRTNEVSYINWIESIPYKETRNYVQRVIENYLIYQKVILAYESKKHIKINDILENG